MHIRVCCQVAELRNIIFFYFFCFISKQETDFSDCRVNINGHWEDELDASAGGVTGVGFERKWLQRLNRPDIFFGSGRVSQGLG